MAKPKIIAIVVVVVALLGVGAFLIFNASRNTQPAGNNVSDVVATPPLGCQSSTSVTVISDEAGTQHITTANSNFVHWRIDQGLLIFTNYTLDTNDIYSNITGDRVLTVIKLVNNDGTQIDEGFYRKKAETGTATPNLYSPEYNISTADLAGAVFDNNSVVRIDYFGDDYVCGEVTSDDGSSSINGHFIAKYVDKI